MEILKLLLTACQALQQAKQNINNNGEKELDLSRDDPGLTDYQIILSAGVFGLITGSRGLGGLLYRILLGSKWGITFRDFFAVNINLQCCATSVTALISGKT